MNESHEKLYNLLSEKGLYTKSYEDFTAQFETPEKQRKLYDLIYGKNLYTKSYDEFTGQFFKKKDGAVEPSDGSSQPGDFSWTLKKFFAGSANPWVKGAMDAEEAAYAKSGLLQDHSRYDFGDFDANAVAAEASKLFKASSGTITQKMNSDQEFITGLARIDEKKAGDKVPMGMSYAGYGAQYQAPQYRELTQEEIDKERDSFIKKYHSKYANDLGQTEIKEKIMEMVPEEYRNDKKFLEMLSDRVYYWGGVNTDLDGDGRYNDQPLAQDMMQGLMSGSEDFVNGLIYPFVAATSTEEDMKQYREDMLDKKAVNAGLMTEYTQGIASSASSGDIYSAFKQTMTGLSQAAPGIAASLTGAPGAIALGFSSGFNAYAEVADDDSFVSDGAKYGYALANGVGDFAFARIGNGIFSRATKFGESTYLASKEAAKNQGRVITKEMLRGYALRKGIAFTSEGLEEAATELTTQYIATVGRGEYVDFSAMMNNALDAAIIGGSAGVSIDYVGNISGRARGAANARAQLQAETQRALEEQKAAIELELGGLADGDPRRRDLAMELNRVNSDIESIVRGRQDFYTMLATRYPDEFAAMQTLDFDIERLAKTVNDENLSGSARTAIENRLKEKVKQRLELQERFANENVQLTEEEASKLYDNAVSESMKNLDAEIKSARESVAMLQEKSGTESADLTALAKAESILEDLTAKKKESLRLMGEIEGARRSLKSTRAEGETELADPTAFQENIALLTSLEQSLTTTLGVSEKVVSGPSRFVGDILDINAQIANRATPQWTEAQIQAMDSSSLTKEALDGIFSSDNYAMLTGENPNATAVSDKTNSQFNKNAEKWLKKNNLKYHKIVGRYGNGENSFLVEGMTKEQAAQFAREFQQESVAHKDGLVLRDGSMQAFSDGVSYDDALDNYFSAIKDSEGNILRFAKNLEEKYYDKDGNEITSDEFNSKIKELELNTEGLIEQVIAEAKETPKKKEGPKREKGLPEGSFKVGGKDGSPNVTIGKGGVLTSSEAKSVNNFYKLFKSVFGDDVQMILIPERSADVMGEGNGGLYVDGETKTIYLAPSQIRINSAVESEAAKEAGVAYRTKSFSETVAEEVAHAVVGPSFRKLPKAKQIEIHNEALKIASKDKQMYNRLLAKKQTYEDDGQSPSDVMEEVVIDLISAMAGGTASIDMSIKDSVRRLYNKILAYAYGKTGKQLELTDPSQIMLVGEALNAARKSGSLFNFNVDSYGDIKPSGVVKPHALKKGDDGKVSVIVHKTAYSWRNGVKKDIGTEREIKKFTDQWHFINWWKKATNMGQDDYYAAFETTDGKTISVDDIKGYKSKRSAYVEPIDIVGKTNIDRINAAEKQGFISPAVAMRLRNKTNKTIALGDNAKLSDIQWVEGETKKVLDAAQKAYNKTLDFEPDTERGMASQAIKLELFRSEKLADMRKVEQYLKEYYGMGEMNAATTNALLSKFISDHFGIDYKNMTEEELKKALTSASSTLLKNQYGDTRDRIRMFGLDPVEFFENNRKANKLHLERMMSTGFLSNDMESEEIAYNFIKGLCSAGQPSYQNIMLAANVMYHSAEWRASGGDSYIDPVIISDIRNGKNTSGIMVANSASRTREAIANALDKLNVEIKKHQKADGSYDMRAFLDEMNEVIDVSPDGVKTFRAQKAFSDKIGSFSLNLNGNEEAITIDSHVSNFFQKMLGTYSDPSDRFEKVRDRIAEAVDMKSREPKQKDIFGDHETEMLGKLANMVYEYSKKEGKENKRTYNRLNRLLTGALGLNPPAPQAFKDGDVKKVLRRRIMEMAIIEGAKNMDLTPAQFTQLIFADDQVMKAGLGEKKGSYFEFLGASRDVMPEDAPPMWELGVNLDKRYIELLADKNRIQAINEAESIRVKRKVMEQSLAVEGSSEATQADEARASSSIRPSLFNRIEDAVDSPLYRNRTAAEALQVKPGMVMTDKLVNESLSTDATSRRIMAKNVKISDGQKVGVRLNLNVMKNTGVPVQTMHDKSASGEALKYSPVVMVKNPTLFVNQNAQRKIMTFQDNKFPMASVDGEFLTDRISEANFNGVKAFFNPFKHNVFVDAQGRPIKSAGEATIVGNTVYLRGDIEYYDYNDPILRQGREETAEQRAKRVKRGDKYEKALNRFKAYSERVLGKEFADRADLEESYDNMPITSQVALDESEAASRAEEAQTRASARLVLRKTADRYARKYGSIREDILANPENYYSKQSIARAKDRLKVMTDQELVDMMTDDALGRLQNRNDDMGVLASSELINRAVARGDMDAVKGYVEQAAQIGTTAGRLLRHFRELKKSSPRGLVEVMKKEIEARGRTLSEQQQSALEAMAGNLFRLQAEIEDLMRKGALGEDVDAEINEKVRELKEAERDLDTFANTNIEKGWGEIGSMLIKGNLLTPISQVTNVGANLVNAMGQIGVDLISYPIESLINIFSKNAQEARKPSLSAYLYGVRKFGSGFMEALDEVMTGQQQDVTEWRVSRGFMPFRSLLAAVNNDNLPLMKDGEPFVIDQQRLKLFVQGTLGVPAEVMFRLLSLGDTPFRRMFEGIELYNAGKSMGLEGDALNSFLKYPTSQQKAIAEEVGKKITFQADTDASRMADQVAGFFEEIFDKIPLVDGKWLVSTFIPYKRTPANMLMETLTFVAPPIAIARMYNAMTRGDNKEAAQNLGKAVIGGMATQTAIMLIKEGLMSGPIDFGDDEERNLAYDQFPPNSINISGLKRLLAGGDPSKQEDDYFFNYSKLGIIGAVMGSTAKANQKVDLQERGDQPMDFITHAIQDAFGLNAIAGVSHMMDQSFLQGVQGLTSVLSATEEADLERSVENWFKSMWQATTAMALPNTMSALYRSHREYLPNTTVTKDMDFGERIYTRMKYTVLDRTFGLNDVPVRVNWKGEPIEQTPRGANSWFYQLFDITKARQGEADPVSNEIYRLYESTDRITRAVGDVNFASTSAVSIPDIDSSKEIAYARQNGIYLPWMKDKEFSRQRIRLNTEEIGRLKTIVGKNRYMELEKLINSQAYKNMSDDERVDAMDEINRKYSRAWSYEGPRLMEHTIELCNIIQEKYESERNED